jgi:hypothetical protein
LVVGSLAQLDVSGQRGDLAQQCQVLRFYYDPQHPNLVWMQRLIAVRSAGHGAAQGASIGKFRIRGADTQTMAFEL